MRSGARVMKLIALIQTLFSDSKIL